MPKSSLSYFYTLNYLRHNQRRQEHLASLNLPIAGRAVLELGAGVGSHTTFFLDRGCRVVSVEARRENVEAFQAVYVANKRYAAKRNLRLVFGDIESEPGPGVEAADIVYCYGLLYHLKDPERAIRWISAHCTSFCLLETRVSMGADETVNPTSEDRTHPTAGLSGIACRPTRPWVFNRLKECFEHVYVPRTQPWHEEFPVDWTAVVPPDVPVRAVFVASREPLTNPNLLSELPLRQTRH